MCKNSAAEEARYAHTSALSNCVAYAMRWLKAEQRAGGFRDQVQTCRMWIELHLDGSCYAIGICHRHQRSTDEDMSSRKRQEMARCNSKSSRCTIQRRDSLPTWHIRVQTGKHGIRTRMTRRLDMAQTQAERMNTRSTKEKEQKEAGERNFSALFDPRGPLAAT